jgi:glycosyltransferase 2 family protein
MRSRLRAILILLLTVGLLAYFLRNADMAGVWAETRHARGSLLALAVGATLLTYTFRAFRWLYLLAPIGHARFSTAFETTTIGFAASFLLPARAGEVLRPYLLARREQLPATACFATIILERLLDLVTVLLLFGVFVALVDPASMGGDPALYARVKLGGLAAAAGSLAGLAVFFALAGHPERLGRTALRVERVLPPRLAQAVARFVETFAQGLGVMRQPRRLFVSLLLSFPLWLSIAAGIWLTSRAFHMTFGYLGSFLVMTLLVVGVAMPTPGAIGGFHAMYQITVTTFFGVPTDRAVGGAIVLHAISFLPVTILGLLFMAREGLSLTRMRKMAAEEGTNDGGKTAERTTEAMASEGRPPSRLRASAGQPSAGTGSAQRPTSPKLPESHERRREVGTSHRAE